MARRTEQSLGPACAPRERHRQRAMANLDAVTEPGSSEVAAIVDEQHSIHGADRDHEAFAHASKLRGAHQRLAQLHSPHAAAQGSLDETTQPAFVAFAIRDECDKQRVERTLLGHSQPRLRNHHNIPIAMPNINASNAG